MSLSYYHFSFISWPSLSAICPHISTPAPLASHSCLTLKSIEEGATCFTDLAIHTSNEWLQSFLFSYQFFPEYKRNICLLYKICKIFNIKRTEKLTSHPFPIDLEEATITVWHITTKPFSVHFFSSLSYKQVFILPPSNTYRIYKGSFHITKNWKLLKVLCKAICNGCTISTPWLHHDSLYRISMVEMVNF